jgi:hypothetical protein
LRGDACWHACSVLVFSRVWGPASLHQSRSSSHPWNSSSRYTPFRFQNLCTSLLYKRIYVAATMSDLGCFAHRQMCVCDRCEEEIQLINMAQWEFAEWESGISWCRRCFQMCGQFKTERNTGPRVPDKKKQAHVNTSVHKICAQHPVSWSECMTCIDAEFPDPTETCKFLQSDAKRVPKTSVGKHCELVRPVASC